MYAALSYVYEALRYARFFFFKALDLDPTCAGALLHRARAYVLVGDFTEAVSDFERVLGSAEILAGASVRVCV